MLSQRKRKHYYKTLGTRVINSPMFPPSLQIMHLTKINVFLVDTIIFSITFFEKVMANIEVYKIDQQIVVVKAIYFQGMENNRGNSSVSHTLIY